MATKILMCGKKPLVAGVDYEELAGPKFRVLQFGYIGEAFQLTDLAAGTVTDLTLTRQDATGVAGDRVEPADAVQWDVSSTPAGGGAKVLLTFGGYTSMAGFYLDANSPSSGGISASRDEETSTLAPFDGDIVGAHLYLGTANINQDWKVWKRDTDSHTFSTPNANSINTVTFATPVSVTKGDKVNIEFDAGSVPGNARVDLLLEET